VDASCVQFGSGGIREVMGDKVYLHLLRMFKLQYCTKFGQLILRKIVKFFTTRSHILRLKCTKIDFGWGSDPDPAGGAYSAPPDPLAGFKGSYF